MNTLELVLQLQHGFRVMLHKLSVSILGQPIYRTSWVITTAFRGTSWRNDGSRLPEQWAWPRARTLGGPAAGRSGPRQSDPRAASPGSASQEWNMLALTKQFDRISHTMLLLLQGKTSKTKMDRESCLPGGEAVWGQLWCSPLLLLLLASSTFLFLCTSPRAGWIYAGQ